MANEGTKVQCPHCGQDNWADRLTCLKCETPLRETPGEEPVEYSNAFDSSGWRVMAWLLILGGVGVVLYFIFGFATTVKTPGDASLGLMPQQVHNMGLLADRQIGVNCGLAGLIVGSLIEAGCLLRSTICRYIYEKLV